MAEIRHWLDDAKRNEMGIEKEWITTEINPEEIAEALGGKLEESSDADSKWNIHLYYGRKNPVLTLKIDPEKRKILVAIHGPKRQNFFTYYYSGTFYEIESTWFVRYRNKSGELFSDLRFLARMGKDQKAGGFIISNYYHRAFEEIDSERKKKGEKNE